MRLKKKCNCPILGNIVVKMGYLLFLKWDGYSYANSLNEVFAY